MVSLPAVCFLVMRQTDALPVPVLTLHRVSEPLARIIASEWARRTACPHLLVAALFPCRCTTGEPLWAESDSPHLVLP